MKKILACLLALPLALAACGGAGRAVYHNLDADASTNVCKYGACRETRCIDDGTSARKYTCAKRTDACGPGLCRTGIRAYIVYPNTGPFFPCAPAKHARYSVGLFIVVLFTVPNL